MATWFRGCSLLAISFLLQVFLMGSGVKAQTPAAPDVLYVTSGYLGVYSSPSGYGIWNRWNIDPTDPSSPTGWSFSVPFASSITGIIQYTGKMQGNNLHISEQMDLTQEFDHTVSWVFGVGRYFETPMTVSGAYVRGYPVRYMVTRSISGAISASVTGNGTASAQFDLNGATPWQVTNNASLPISDGPTVRSGVTTSGPYTFSQYPGVKYSWISLADSFRPVISGAGLDTSTTHSTLRADIDYTVSASIDPAQVAVTSAKMISNHKIEVKVNTSGYTGTRPVSISANINGSPISTPDKMLPPGDNSVIIDLANPSQTDPPLPVPRFTSNQRFTITAHLKGTDGRDHKASKNMVILLPVVTMVGVRDNWPGGHFENLLTTACNDYIKTLDVLGNGYNNPNYFGVWPLSYSVTEALRGDLSAGVAPFLKLLSDIKSHTWADKVDVIGYSFGGITARACVAAGITTPNGENVIHSVITLGTPHAGTPWARWALSDGRLAPNMRPLWSYWRRRITDSYSYYPPGANLKLAWLSGMNGSSIEFPMSIPLYLFYSDSFTGGSILSQLPGSLYTITELPPHGENAEGDRFITTDSQTGVITDPTTSETHFLKAFRAGIAANTIIPVPCPGEDHNSFANSKAVSAKMISYLLKDIR